eukprot:14752-Heterococcus_DN1.PRE.1
MVLQQLTHCTMCHLSATDDQCITVNYDSSQHVDDRAKGLMEYTYKTQLVDVDLSPIADLITDHFMVHKLLSSPRAQPYDVAAGQKSGPAWCIVAAAAAYCVRWGSVQLQCVLNAYV